MHERVFEDAQISLIRKLHGLSDLDVASFAAGLVILRGTWSVERFEDCDGEVSLLLTPQNVDDDTLTFSVDRGSAGLRLIAWRGDTHGMLGSFTCPKELLSFVWKLVEAECSRASDFETETFRRACQLVSQAGIVSPH